MTTRIATVGLSAGLFFDGVGALPSFADPLTREDLERLVDLVNDDPDAQWVVLYQASSSEPTLRRLQTVRSALDTARVATYAVAVPPLAAAVLASMAAAIAPHLPSAGVLVAGLPALEQQLLVLAWLGRVSSLKEPNPTVWQHLASLWPTTAFAVSYWPEPAVRRIRKDDEPLSLPRASTTVGLAVAAADGDREWIDRAVLPALGQTRIRDVESPDASAAWWGTNRLVEVVAYPLDAAATAKAISASLSRAPCRWCKQDIAAARCPFCGAAASRRGVESAGEAAA